MAEAITTNELAELVKQMREAQRNYFRSKPGTDEKQKWLATSKQLERTVDAEVARVLNPPEPTLFDEPS